MPLDFSIGRSTPRFPSIGVSLPSVLPVLLLVCPRFCQYCSCSVLGFTNIAVTLPSVQSVFGVLLLLWCPCTGFSQYCCYSVVHSVFPVLLSLRPGLLLGFPGSPRGVVAPPFPCIATTPAAPRYITKSSEGSIIAKFLLNYRPIRTVLHSNGCSEKLKIHDTVPSNKEPLYRGACLIDLKTFLNIVWKYEIKI